MTKAGLMIVAIGVVSGCSSGEGAGQVLGEAHVLDNQGFVCVEDPQLTDTSWHSCEAHALDEGEPVRIRVDFDTCYSGNCAEPGEARCNARLAGTVIQVTSEGSVYDLSAPGKSCDSDCNGLAAYCETPPLSSGDYEIRYAGKVLPIRIPSVTAKRCMPDQMVPNCCDTNFDCASGTCASDLRCGP